MNTVLDVEFEMLIRHPGGKVQQTVTPRGLKPRGDEGCSIELEVSVLRW